MLLECSYMSVCVCMGGRTFVGFGLFRIVLSHPLQKVPEPTLLQNTHETFGEDQGREGREGRGRDKREATEKVHNTWEKVGRNAPH